MILNKLKKIYLYIIFLLSFLFAINYIISMKFIKTVEKTILFKSHNTPEGLKILQISDLHSNNPKKININIWKKIDKLDFDIVVITGDIVINNKNQIESHIPYINELAKNYPVYYVQGNHDLKGYDYIKQLLTDSGVVVLDNEKVEVKYNDMTFNLIGLRDYYYLRKTNFNGVFELLDGINNDNFNIILEHQPQFIDYISEYNFDLMISGHTHGGQIRLPFMPTLYAPGQGILPKYGDGLYKVNNTYLYISKGIGTTIFPIRLFNRPEIAVLTIEKE